ncbi:hypothetical protein CL634_05990 [bacterium]|nr:hypothetical protein [bacterium]
MDNYITEILEGIVEQAKNEDCNIIIKQVENDGYLLTNEKIKRIAGVGLVHIKNETDEVEEVVGAFTIDVSKYKWAETEGFSHDQMIDDLTGEIFNLIGVDEVFDYLCPVKYN